MVLPTNPSVRAAKATRRKRYLIGTAGCCLIVTIGSFCGLGNNLSASVSRIIMYESGGLPPIQDDAAHNNPAVYSATANAASIMIQNEIHTLGLDQFLLQRPQSSQVTFLSKAPPNKNQDSRTATVMGMATNYDLYVYRRFIGSLRATGYLGNIVLAISPQPKPGVEEYLQQEHVIMKRLNYVNCSTDIMKGQELTNPHDKEVMTCADPYPDLKVRWGRFALLRDYLKECQTCTGPVLVADVRDTFFQRDPFGPEAPPVVGLELAEEHRKMRTTHWLVAAPVSKCKKINPIFDKPMLCSGTTIGTRLAMLDYLQIMVDEMRVWMGNPDCCCNKMNGDDQSIHNYLYYTGKLPFATVARNRVGLVHTVGAQGAMIFNLKRQLKMDELKMEQGKAAQAPYDGADEDKGMWLGLHYDLTDSEGYFLDFDGSRSFIVHQYDRFGGPLDRWVSKKVSEWVERSSVSGKNATSTANQSAKH